LARNHGLLRRVDDLLEQRDAGAERNAKGDHMCTITDSTGNATTSAHPPASLSFEPCVA
jgi:hypothetical protein